MVEAYQFIKFSGVLVFPSSHETICGVPVLKEVIEQQTGRVCRSVSRFFLSISYTLSDW